MRHLKVYENFQMNESVWSDFLSLVKKGEEKMFTIFAPKQIKEIEEKVESMTDMEKMLILDKIDRKITKWKRAKGLLALIALFNIILFFILGQHLSEIGINDNIPVNYSITMIYWTMALFMQSRNEIIKEKVHFKKIEII